MKRFKQIWRRFVEKHIVQKDPYSRASGNGILYSPLKHYPCDDGTGPEFIIEQDIVSEQAICHLREEGWDVQLRTDASGKLFYAVYDNLSG